MKKLILLQASVLAKPGSYTQNLVFSPFCLLFCITCRGREIKCKHLVATALCAVLWRNHRQERPSWAVIRARQILTQEDRVRLDRNFSWTQLLDFTLRPYPTGRGYWSSELESVDVTALSTPKQKTGKAKAVSRGKSKKRKQESSEEEGSNKQEEESYARPPRKKRVLEAPEVTAKYNELVGATKNETDSTIKKWIEQHYEKFWKSITYTGKQQALRALANLLVADL